MTVESFVDGKVILHPGDCLDVLKTLATNSVDSIVTDPPYHLTANKKGGTGTASVNLESPYGRARIGTGNGAGGFMGKAWDGGDIAFRVELWAEVFRVLKPGGHVAAFGGTRTIHRMTCAIEDAGFEIRDQLQWLYGSGFPKSLDVSKTIDKAAGAERDVIANGKPVKRMIPGADQHKGGWEKTNGRVYVPGDSEPATAAAKQWGGFGTALKPACEPICLARKPLIGTVAENVLQHGTGALNIDGCRVEGQAQPFHNGSGKHSNSFGGGTEASHYRGEWKPTKDGRWPANVIHDGSDEVVGAFPESAGQQGDVKGSEPSRTGENGIYGHYDRVAGFQARNDSGSAARFFYTAKADADDRLGSKHPTVKPLDLMQWLVRLVTPPGGLVLDPFAGTGTTGEAAWREGFNTVLIEREPEYQADIRRRMALCLAGPDERKRESIKARNVGKPADHGPLFAGSDTPPPGQTDLRRLRGRTIGPTGLKW